MGKVIIEKWQCDRCGIIAERRPYGNGRSHYEINVSVDYETAGGCEIKWKEMCGECDRAVGFEVDAMNKSSAEAQERVRASQ